MTDGWAWWSETEDMMADLESRPSRNPLSLTVKDERNMDGKAMGDAIGGAIISAIIIALVVGGAIAIGLWELAQWVYSNVSISVG